MLFIFLLPEQKKNETKRKFAVCIFLPTPVLFSAKEKELATLKQLFLFNAPKSTSASRQKKRPDLDAFVGKGRDNIAPLVKENTHLNERSNVEPSLEDRPLVEEREEFFALSREEEKAV